MLPTLSLPIPVLILFAPVLLWLVGLTPASLANTRPHLMARLNGGAAWLAFTGTLAAAVIYLFDGTTQAWTLFSIPLPGDIGAFTIGTYLNSVTVIMLLLVSFVGAIVSRYARNYLDGDPNQGRFHKWLTLTLASILTLIVSGNLLMFALAWIATSLCLHQLLMFYRERSAAVLAAHKKFIASRIGDATLLLAVLLIGSSLHTLEFNEIFEHMATMDGPLSAGLQVASLLVVLSAALKSAQFPFHGWLIQVMEAPTPVSALLHAGIVNAGAFLIIRMSPIVSHSATALAALATIGLVTLTLASLVMLTQTSIKVSLAWSTTAQMGFMLLECGLGLFSLAMLHLVAHSLYKAHAFLASGSGVDAFRAPIIRYAPKAFQPVQLLLGLVIAGILAVVLGAAFGMPWEQQPALIAAGAIVAIAVSQLMLQTATLFGNGAALRRAVALSALLCGAYFALHQLFDHALAGSLPPLRDTASALPSGLVPLTIAAFVGLLVMQQFIKGARSNLRDTLYMHLYNGLYIDVYITRLLQRVWPAPHQPAYHQGA
ncbi:NADH-quinone oxidoreductase subunit L [uncultured Lamprocystis sp.]|jgi:NAD(P)H-quinone oxidoreductase subunit 5|uniref:NADH-quinone oxidoreductase subunit L n=1 Tax=uncultured Lamprocystis sp. TaxID=543132 RepID=UPI0025D31AAB|nr:NADH-quinone oxidoreductase subunit L [uncultured Lamprocystis sp.]